MQESVRRAVQVENVGKMETGALDSVLEIRPAPAGRSLVDAVMLYSAESVFFLFFLRMCKK